MPDLDKKTIEPERYELPKRLQRLENRVKQLEELLEETFEFLGNETRPIFGQSHLAALYDAVVKRCQKVFGAKNGEK